MTEWTIHDGQGACFTEIRVTNICGGTTHDFLVATPHGPATIKWQTNVGCVGIGGYIAPDQLSAMDLPEGVEAFPPVLDTWDDGLEYTMHLCLDWQGM